MPDNTLLYALSSPEDILNGYSPEGYELPSETFLAFMALNEATLPSSGGIVLELAGAPLTEEQQQAAARAVHVHYSLRLAEQRQAFRDSLIKTVWFIVCFLLSVLMLYISVNTNPTELLAQFLALPFWYFGYRVITYPLQELLPLRRECGLLRRLTAMQLVFADENGRIRAAENSAPVSAEAYFMEDGVMQLECCASSADELLAGRSVKGGERLSDGLTAYLELGRPFIRLRVPVALTVTCPALSEEERQTVRRCIADYLRLKTLQAREEISGNRRRVIGYAAGLVLTSIALALYGSVSGTALHELMLVLFWFFADYLVEFILIERRSVRQAEAVRAYMEKMAVSFR